MAPSSQEIRVLALALEDLSDFRHSFTRHSALFRSLDDRFSVVGQLRPLLTTFDDILIKAVSIYPSRSGWRGRAALNRRAFRRRSEIVESELRRSWNQQYDLLFQLQTLF
jgi:hypothetical protein